MINNPMFMVDTSCTAGNAGLGSVKIEPVCWRDGLAPRDPANLPRGSFRGSGPREGVDAVLGIRGRGCVPRAPRGWRLRRREANPGEGEPGCDQGEEEEVLHSTPR